MIKFKKILMKNQKVEERDKETYSEDWEYNDTLSSIIQDFNKFWWIILFKIFINRFLFGYWTAKVITSWIFDKKQF